jgi:hypothetical protein
VAESTEPAFIFDDLALAKSAIDWTEANLPPFKERMREWVNLNIRTKTVELDENPTHDMIIGYEREPFPLSFSVEYGAYINVIRSSLDIMACAVATRHNITQLDNVYFPVASSEDKFIGGNYKGHQFIERLPKPERDRFVSLKPYKGGDNDIWLLHHLDIERKHRRLLVEPRISGLKVMGWGLNIIPINGEVGANGETALFFAAKGAQFTNFQITAAVAINESSLAIRQEAWSALKRLSDKARSILTEFSLN